ncbi:MAG: TetR/AcrR family transcriptional regulator [Pseudomonadota bacterium]
MTQASADEIQTPGAGQARPVRRSQAERREESRRRMLDAAFELLSEQQSIGFTLSDVGERAGYSRGLPTQAFGSKAGLLGALTVHLLNMSVNETSPVETRGEGLEAVLITVRQLLEGSELQYRVTMAVQVLFAEASVRDSPIRVEMTALNRIATGYLSKHLRIGQARGEVKPDIDCRAQAMITMAMVRGVMLQWLLDPERIDREVLCRETMASLERNLRP